MIHICRAEDGQVIQVNASLRDIERSGSLELFLHRETGVDEEAILAYLSDGRRLRNENLREFAGSQDQAIYVFNKYYLDLDLDEVLRDLRIEPPLQPPIEDSIAATPPFRPSQLATSFLRTAHVHHDHVSHLLSTLRYQHEALRIASSSLDLHVLTIADAFETVAAGARKELEKQASLLAGLENDLELISRVKVHLEFMSPVTRKAIESGEKVRTLGDYVSSVKMKQVAETCSRTHEELKAKFAQTEEGMTRLSQGTDVVRSIVGNLRTLDDAEACFRRSKDILDKTMDAATSLESPSSDPDGLLQELKQLDNNLRNEVLLITDAKNSYTEQCIGALRRISTLNNDLVFLPTALTTLQTSFRSRNGFSHIQRLHTMLYAYGATVIEVVRRKEFARFFYQRAQSILEVMAKLSAGERRRQQVYRGEVHGQLPFETRLDDNIPTIDFSPSGSLDANYSIERADVDELLRVLDDLERFARSNNNAIAMHALLETRAALDKLINKMESLESGFDRIAERSLLSASRLSSSRRRSTEADEQAFQELTDQLHEAQQSKAHQETLFQEERITQQAELRRFNALIENLHDAANSERDRGDRLERDLHHARAQVDSEVTARRIMEERHSDISADADKQQEALAKALADATEQAKEAEFLRQELAQVRTEFEDVKALETRNAAKFASLLEDQAVTLRNLEEARARGEDLCVQIQVARAESEEVNQALKEAGREKDRLLRAQASEHDRIMRDHIAEADGDRAVLEHQFAQLKAEMQEAERQLKDARSQNEITNADGAGLREELQRVEHELREARHAEKILRDDLKAGRASQCDFEQRLEDMSRLVAEILDVAIAFRNSHVKALSTAQNIISHPSSVSKASPSLADSGFPSSLRHSIIGQAEEPSPIDPSDPPTALEALRAFDHDHFLDTIGKTGSTIRKWQKQCKEYRERAKGKISFRNFAKGDLALFLPTRNSVSKPWAAFNVSFPHYFLQATGHLAEQLKTREWIVARITSITERVVDHNDPSSNPYGLGDGVKYYMLEVEDWTQPTQANKRRVSSRRVSSDQAQKDIQLLTSPPSTLPSSPPQAEVEDSFRVTRPPTSHLFPVRTRANSSPIAGPSSLSKLLAQAPAETSLEAIPPSRSKTPSPTTSPPPPPSPPHTGSVPRQVSVPSPLRPGSRASRMSSSSKFSTARIPFASASTGSSGVVKAAPTTAITDHSMASSPSSSDSNTAAPQASPSPSDSISEGMSNLLTHRRRTTSYHTPRTSPLAKTIAPPGMGGGNNGVITAGSTLANFATNWGVAFGRKKRPALTSPTSAAPPAESMTDVQASAEREHVAESSSARELLRRF